MSGPQVGYINRDKKILSLFDTGEYAPKRIARMMREIGYEEVTVNIVRDAVKRREKNPMFYVEKSGHFVSAQELGEKQSTA